MLILVAAPSYGYDRAQVEADAALIAAYEEENRIFKDLEWKEEPSAFQWYLFYTLQAADVYSTYRGLQYDCVREANPLLGERPGIARMVTHKTVFLSPFGMLQIEGGWTVEELRFVNTVGTVIIVNNYTVWNRARKQCKLR